MKTKRKYFNTWKHNNTFNFLPYIVVYKIPHSTYEDKGMTIGWLWMQVVFRFERRTG